MERQRKADFTNNTKVLFQNSKEQYNNPNSGKSNQEKRDLSLKKKEKKKVHTRTMKVRKEI